MGLATNFVGELLGTFILVFFGCGVAASSTLFSAHTGLFQVAGVWGIGVTLAIYASRHLSCAHLNPAVSLAMVVSGRMEPRKLPTYLAAQFLGAFIAGWVLLGVFGDSIAGFEALHRIVRGSEDSIKTASLFGEYFPNPTSPETIAVISKPMAALVEALGTFFLVTIIFFLTDDCNVGRPSSDIAPMFIGLTVMGIISLLAPLTQAGLNPARDFGPRLVAYLSGWGWVAIPGPRGGFFTVYILGPLLGGTAAAVLFRGVFQRLMGRPRIVCTCGEDIKK
ncbi:MAG: aquaporin family protein [Deltaproteobacteria bacterium]|nr:aquaporin family protein [Deltaproteobacteria bacterium]